LLNRFAGRLLAVLARLALVGWLLFATLVLVLRYLVLPNIGGWHAEIEELAGRAIGQSVHIEKVSAGWRHLHPELQLEGVRVVDAQGRETLSFTRVDAVLSWRSLALFDLRLRRIVLAGPQLHVERRADGELRVAGVLIDRNRESDPTLANWVLQQPDVVISDARIYWRDVQRDAPELLLDQVNLRLDNQPGRHLVSLRAVPPASLGGPLDLRGEFTNASSGASLTKLDDWQGAFYLASGGLDFKMAQQWLDSPLDLASGQGAVRLWGKLAGGRIEELSADLALRDVDLRLTGKLPRLVVERMQGRLRWRQSAAGDTRVTGYDVALALADGVVVEPTSFHVEWAPSPLPESVAASGGNAMRGLAIVTATDIGQLMHLTNFLPLDDASRALLAGYAPSGRVANLKVSWHGTGERLLAYGAEADFVDLALQPRGNLPGFAGLSGHLRADENNGRVELVGGPTTLDFPTIFNEPQIALDELHAKAEWQWQATNGAAPTLTVDLQEASFSGPDAAGSAHGQYRFTGQGLGEIDLSAQVHEASLAAAWRYMPKAVPASVAEWLQHGLVGGSLRQGRLVLRGPLDRFPFADPAAGGQFLLNGQIEGGAVAYSEGWPQIDHIAGEIAFAGAGLSVAGGSGNSAGASLSKVSVQLPDFSAPKPTLLVAGEARGNLDDFTRFLETSPVGEMLGRFYQEIKISGNAGLKLDLLVPLDAPEQARVRGEVEFAGNQVLVDPMLPPVSEVRGHVGFSEKSATASNLAGVFLGQPARATIVTAGDELKVSASGGASVSELRKHYGHRLLGQLSGSLPWKSDVAIKKGRVTIKVESSLEGLASTLPEPFRKSAEAPMPVRFSRTPLPERTSKGAGGRDQLDLDVGDALHVTLLRRGEAGKKTIERGIVAVGETHSLPASGLLIAVRQDSLQADAWRAAIGNPAGGGATSMPGGGQASTDVDWPTPTLDLRAKSLQLFGRVWKDVKLQASPTKTGLVGQIETPDMAGSWEWERAGKGKFKARLQQLLLPDEKSRTIFEPVAANGPQAQGDAEPEQLPALDIVAEQLLIGQRRIGRIELQAENEAKAWHISRFSLVNQDGNVVATGRWQPEVGESGLTAVKFQLEANDLGKWLGRFGYADAVRDGKGTLEGEISWHGSPARLTPPTLTGSMKAKAEKGQFNKLEPGFGKLLSLLSLQMLPRRAVLDFRDVFSEGFAFDRINGTVNVHDGIMRTNDLAIEGSAAKVEMKGEVDLAKETQNVRVTVQPELSGSAAMGAALLVNPATGVALLLGQKILRDPLNKAFAFEYDIKGAWADPIVEKVGRSPAPGKDENGKANDKPARSTNDAGINP
jgi:uncharacterized protein (TIGR02099 family)